MGWSISHGGTRHGYSYNSVAELLDLIKEHASWRQRLKLKLIIDRRSGDPFSVPPAEAQAVGDIFLDVADRLPAEWSRMARQIGHSALRAASSGNEPWVWS
ncbi:hypothetical protein [Streptomyces sp. NPDC058667]|uniref:DUF7739 domain-containing protein n=1 Tax=Streptomyces sp. NPDC058667 TaxID=3346588 RepID=UPI00365C41E6